MKKFKEVYKSMPIANIEKVRQIELRKCAKKTEKVGLKFN
jgi:hypothetical protein